MMQKEKILSIVIITCNRKDELKKTIESCIKMANMPIEIIVIDNGSNDGTKDMLESMKYTDECTLRPYYSKVNMGVSGGRNKGFELASSEIVLFIDDDAVFAEDSKKMNTAYEYMISNEQVGALAFDIYDLKENGKLLDSFKNDDSHQKEILSFVGACHMLRKTHDRENLYPPKLMYGAEERYASILYYDLGLKVEYFPDIKVLHNPSTKTRMSRINTHRNVMINQYVIKRLLLPKQLNYKTYMFFMIRQIKRERFNVLQIIKNNKEAKRRIRDNISSVHVIKKETIEKICKDYGKFVII